MPAAKVATREEWLAARKALLAKEEHTHVRDALNRERLALPWVKVEKRYVFEGADGKETLADLFGPRSQLVIKHFMFAPDWEEGCLGCSFEVDHVGGALAHLEHHDVSYLAVSRAPWPKIAAYQQRMGWQFKWVSSHGSDFNYDFHASFPKNGDANGKVFSNFEVRDFEIEDVSGRSAFYKDEKGDVFHTYSGFERGNEEVLGTYMLLDLTPKGRNEKGPRHNLTDWVRRHDRYDNGASDEDQIRAMVAEWAEALRAKDAGKVVSCLAPGNVMFVLAPPLQHKSGPSPDKKGVEEWFASFRGPLGFEVRDLVVVAGAEVAFCHSLNHLTGTKNDGERADYWFRETLGFRKLAGKWKITHDHESVPVHMDGSGRAAFDLEPE